VWDAASEAAGFDDIQVDVMKPYAFRFRALARVEIAVKSHPQ